MSDGAVIRDDRGRVLRMAGCVCLKCEKTEVYINRLLAERDDLNKSWNERCLAAERRVLELMAGADAALQRRVDELETQVNRTCIDCDGLVDHPANVHCGACA